jgi:hypothetical protein
MNQNEYLKFHKEMCDKMVDITRAKNADYANSKDPFANFRSCEKLQICSTEQGFLTRMLDKMARINTFCQNGALQVKEESVFDSLIDLANYSILMCGYIRSKNEAKSEITEHHPV